MFKVMKESKIIGISDEYPVLLGSYDVVEDTEHSVGDYEQYNGEYLLKSDIPAPTYEEQRQKRAAAYVIKVDPITANIQRERDEPEPDEDEIAALISERAEKVAEIKAMFPYPEEEEEEGGE